MAEEEGTAARWGGQVGLVNQHELASNKECIQTCCCRACWNGAGMASNQASWNGSGKNMHKYGKNMQVYVKHMNKTCIHICNK